MPNDELFVARLREIVRGDAPDFARRAGIKPRTLNGYLSDGVEPTLGQLRRMAEAGHVSLDWLVMGREQPSTSDHGNALNESLLRDCYLAVEELNEESALGMNPDQRWRLIMLVYRGMIEEQAAAPSARVLTRALRVIKGGAGGG